MASKRWVEDTLDLVGVPGGRDEETGGPFVVTIRRLPAAQGYLAWENPSMANIRETWRRWAELAIVAPMFDFSGTGDGIPWDSLPLPTHKWLADRITSYSFELNAEAKALEDAFRGGKSAGAEDGGAGRGSGSDSDLAPGILPEPTIVAIPDVARSDAET